MSFIEVKNRTLYVEDVAAPDIAAQFSTPTYVYSRASIEHRWHSLDRAFGDYPHEICYAVKANSNLAILNLLARMGSGFDIVSMGELYRVLQAGGAASNTVFSGVAKSSADITYAIQHGIGCFNVESSAELDRIQSIAAELNTVVRIALRVNPNVDAGTHPYIATGMETAKFGIPIQSATDLYLRAQEMSHIEVYGVACHIGSQITSTLPFQDALHIVLDLVNDLSAQGVNLRHLDLGGGLGVDYQESDQSPSAATYVNDLLEVLQQRDIKLPVAIEPGRFLVAQAGLLLTRIEYLKCNQLDHGERNFAIVDAGMNDLLRPSLYSAYHRISEVSIDDQLATKTYEVVGPVCESADVLGSERSLAIKAGDLLAVHDAGAYSFSMASNYNSRPCAAEVLIDGDSTHLVRPRETLADLCSTETVIAE